jgi:hypothetical protein
METDERTERQELATTQEDSLLSAEQRAVCEQVAAGDTLDSRRAQALLAIDDDATQAEAGRLAGLTPGQVKYCLHRFRQLGLDMFSGVTLDVIQTELDPIPDPVSEPDLAASVGGTETVVEKPGNKAGNKTAKGKKGKKKTKKSKGKDEGGKKRGKLKSGKSSPKKGKKNGDKPSKKKSKKKDKR